MPAVAVKKKSGLLSGSQHPGKKTMSAAASLEDAEDEKVFLERSVEFSQEGDQLMQKRQYVKALQFYEQAKKLMPKGHELSSSVDANRAECYLLMNPTTRASGGSGVGRVENERGERASVGDEGEGVREHAKRNEAKKDIAQAHALVPNDAQIKQLHDIIHGIGSGEDAGGVRGYEFSPEFEEERREDVRGRDTVGAAKKNAIGGGTKTKNARTLEAKSEPSADDSRESEVGRRHESVVLSTAIGYRDLVTTLTNKFPDAGQFTIKYTDEKGELRPLQTREDFQIAIHWTSVRLSKLETPSYGASPCVKLTLVELAKIEDMAVLDEDGKPVGLPPNEVVEIDEWILDFAALFREHLGIRCRSALGLSHGRFGKVFRGVGADEDFGRKQRARWNFIRSLEKVPKPRLWPRLTGATCTCARREKKMDGGENRRLKKREPGRGDCLCGQL